jgi:predicted nucleic acid-binding Zn ribbon protein
MPSLEPYTCKTCGASVDPKRLTCPECEQFTPRARTVMIRGAIIFAAIFIPLLLFLVALTLQTIR